MKKYKCVYIDKKERIYYKVTLGKDEVTRKSIQVKSYKNEFGKSFKTTEEAYATMLTVKADYIKNHGLREDESQTFSNFIENVYVPYFSRSVQDSTAYTAKAHFRLMTDYFENKPLNKLTRLDCSDFRMYLLDKFPGKDPRPTASNYAGAVWTRFKAAFTYAYEMNIMKTHPAAGIRTPSKENIKTTYWTFSEFKKAIEAFNLSDFHEQWHATIIWLYYFTGLRVNEGTALKWEDVDFEKAEIKVHQTFSQDNKGRKVLHEHTKTTAGMRTIDLDKQTVKVLKRWESVQPNSSKKGYVIGESGNVAVSKSTVSRLLKSISKKTGVSHVTGKSLRKSHASYLINELKETNVKYVQQRMGHEKIQTTLDYYAEFDSNIEARNEKRKNMENQLNHAGLQLFEEESKIEESTKKSTKLRLVG
ncbi:Putative Tyrosine recombinase XerC-like [Pseudolactococcus piscium]|nr:Putative Tyrosine recombinase XerC-like [Lactococcus piscium]